MCVAWFSCDACFQRFTFTTDLIRRMGFVSRIFVLTSNNNQAGFLVLPKKKKIARIGVIVKRLNRLTFACLLCVAERRAQMNRSRSRGTLLESPSAREVKG